MLTRVTLAVSATVVLLLMLFSILWNDRPELDALGIASPPPADAPVTVSWFGVSTLLIDDGRTQILIDGFISRPSLAQLLLQRPVNNDAATINYLLAEYQVDRLAAIIPVHSHFDHAMDIGAIANRTSASILGSPTTAAIARGANVREEQIVLVDTEAEYTFGDFTVRFIESRHAPFGWRGSVPLAGRREEPLALPAPVNAFPADTSYSVLVSHPSGSALIQGSAGFRDGALADTSVDTVFIGILMLETLGRDYAERYWQETVTTTGANTVVVVHFDDYTQPFGTTRLPPRFIDNVETSVDWLKSFRRRWDTDATLFIPRFGVPFSLYPSDDAEA
jgi:L-ascorbate metabolism protein UlaG (beta-lactamase superfamily)